MSESKHLYIATFGPWTKVGISVNPYKRVKQLSKSIKGKVYRVVKASDVVMLEAGTLKTLESRYPSGGLADSCGYSSEVFHVSPLIASMEVDHLIAHPYTEFCPTCSESFRPTNQKQIYCKPSHARRGRLCAPSAVTRIDKSIELLRFRSMHVEKFELTRDEASCLIGALMRARRHMASEL